MLPLLGISFKAPRPIGVDCSWQPVICKDRMAIFDAEINTRDLQMFQTTVELCLSEYIGRLIVSIIEVYLLTSSLVLISFDSKS